MCVRVKYIRPTLYVSMNKIELSFSCIQAFALLMAIVAVHAAPVEDTMSQYVDTVAQIANDDEEEELAFVRKVRQANEDVTEPSVEATTVEEEGDSSTALPNSSEEEECDSSSSEEVTEPSVEETTVVEEEEEEVVV